MRVSWFQGDLATHKKVFTVVVLAVRCWIRFGQSVIALY